ncbi:MAG: peptidoglycan bridge formation glycyltransferase FemA/FemB family protein [Thermoanaerobacterales bacterium]|nr:peptidoglycan bridge formation glycyltransferase FemA/FemB family protein [Thermoanaerobacterales bacterium]
MELRIIQENERRYFNDFMANGPKGHVLQSFEWGEVKRRTGWQPIRLLVEDDGKPVAGISILKRRIPIPGLNRCILYAPRGPVADFSDEETLRFLFDRVKTLAARHGAIMLKIDPDIKSPDERVENLLKSFGFLMREGGDNFEGIQPQFVFRLDIRDTLENIFASFHHKTRYNIRLSSRKGVTVQFGSREDLKPFYEILQETCKRDKFLVRGFDYFEALWEELVENGLARLFMAEYKGNHIAGTLAFIFGDKAWYIYGASSNENRNVMPNYALQWEMIKWAKQNGCTMYDFRGVSGDTSPENPLYGLYRFKKGFNGEFTKFIGEFDLPISTSLYYLWEKVIPGYRESRRSLVNFLRGLKK